MRSLDRTQTQDHNEANELEKIDDDATHLAHDARGNTTKVPVPGDEANHYYTLTYDAWNRLLKVEDDADPVVTVAEYRYDGLGRCIVKLIPNGNNWDRMKASTDIELGNCWGARSSAKGSTK